MQPTRVLAALALCLAVATSAASAQLKVNDRLPAPKLERLVNTRTKSLADFKGRLLLWIWCDLEAPVSQELVPKLHRLVDPFGKKGFVPVLVSGGSRDQAQAFVDATQARVPIGIEPGLKSHASAGFDGLPIAALVAPDGIVVWLGHPKDVTRDEIELWLRRVTTQTPLDRKLSLRLEVPKALAPAAKDAAEGRLGAADAALAAAETAGIELEVDRMIVADARRGIAELLEFELGCAERADATKRFADAQRLYARIARDFEGSEAAKTAQARTTELGADPRATAELEATARLAEADKLLAEKKRKQAIALLEQLLSSPLATTKAVKDRDLKALLERLKKTN